MITQIKQRINQNSPGWIFSAVDFVDLSDRNTIDQNLRRLCQKGVIRKITTGLYDIPDSNQKFGLLPPDPDKVAFAIAKKFGYDVQVPPAQAANMLGLTTQIPVQPTYLTNGFSKTIKMGNTIITFVRVAPRKMIGIGTKAGLVIQALYYFGKNQIDDLILSRIKGLLSSDDKMDLIKLLKQTPVWMQQSLKRIIYNA